MRGQPNTQQQNPRGDPGLMPEFPVYGPSQGMGIYWYYPAQTMPVRRNPSDIPLNNTPEDYGAYCDPEIRHITEACIEQFPFLSNSGQYQYGTSYVPPIGANYNYLQQQRRPFPFYEWGCMGLYQVQYPDTQYADTKSPFGIDKVYGPSFNEWVTGPWLLAITQEVYQQYNSPLPNPWGEQR